MKDLIYSFHVLVIKLKSVFKRLACVIRAATVAVKFIKSFSRVYDDKIHCSDYQMDVDYEDVENDLFNIGFDYANTRKNR